MGNINDWLNASQTTGSSGETQVTITCDENLSFTERSQTIKVTLNKTGTTAECVIKQKPSFAVGYHIQQTMCVGTGELYTKIYEVDDRDNILYNKLRYSAYVTNSGTVSVSNSDSEISNLLSEIYKCYSYSSNNAILSSSVVYKWDNTGQYDNYFIPVTKSAAMYPQKVSSKYGDGSYALKTILSNIIQYDLNVDYSQYHTINVGFNYGTLLTYIEGTNSNVIGYAGALTLNLANLKVGKVGNCYSATVGLQMQWGNTKKFDYYTLNYSADDTKGFNGLGKPATTSSTPLALLPALTTFNNITKFAYTGTEEDGTQTEDVYQGVYYPFLYDLSYKESSSSSTGYAELKYKFYVEGDFRNFETPYYEWTTDETPAHEIFSSRYGLATLKGSALDGTTLSLSYVSVNE